MESGRIRGYRDDIPCLPTLGLGLTSVRLIVNKLESEYARVANSNSFGNGREIIKYDPSIDDDCDDFPLSPPRGRVWNRFAVNLGIALSKCIPSVTFGNIGVLAVATGLLAPRMISYWIVYPFCRLVFGTLYPAYASYKAVRTKNLKEYVKWMMYWIVFALFTCTETFTDMFLSWFPFYYEVKIVLVLWLLSPATKGSSILYRKFVHPALCRREQAISAKVWARVVDYGPYSLYCERRPSPNSGNVILMILRRRQYFIQTYIKNPLNVEIDEYIAKAKDQGYHTVLNLGTKGVNYATTVIMQTAIKGGGGLVQQLRKSYSLSDLTECDPREERGMDEADDVLAEPRLIRRGGKSGYSTQRSASESNSRSPMYFPEVDVDVRTSRSRPDDPDLSHIKSTEDISSGYSSADNSASLTRTASLGASARSRARTTRTTVTTIKRPQAAEENEVIIEELHDDDTFDYTNMPPLVNAPSPLFISHTDPPFIYQYIGDQVKIVQMLRKFPLNEKINTNLNTELRDQKETINDDVFLTKTVANTDDELTENKTDDNICREQRGDVNGTSNISELKEKVGEVIDESEMDNKSLNYEKENETNPNMNLEHIMTPEEQNNTETTSLDTSLNDYDSADSDDEASFGTPENSPKSKRKSPKGKYGKNKAPPPPILDIKDNIGTDNVGTASMVLEAPVVSTSQESLADIVKNLPNTPFKETGTVNKLQVINPIAEKKRRHKSKSPGRIQRANISGIGKLLHLPSKLAFWQKNDDAPKEDVSTSSGNQSRRSSTIENDIVKSQNSGGLNIIYNDAENHGNNDQAEMSDDQISFEDAAEIESEGITQHIMEKSDALQKLIEAKLESHPEYKFVSLHEEIPTTSKSTDV